MDVFSELNGEKGVDTAELDRSPGTDNVVLYMQCLRFDRVNSLIFICPLRLEGEEFSKMLQFLPERGQYPQVFQNLPDIMVTVFTFTRPIPPRRKAAELDED